MKGGNMFEILVGGVFGVLSTLAGVWATEWLTSRKDRAVRRGEIVSALASVGVWLRAERANLCEDQVFPSDPSAIEALRIKGFLGDLSDPLLSNLISLHAHFLQINDRIDLHRRTAAALISSGAPDKWGGNWGSLMAEAKELRARAVPKIDACLQGIDDFVSGLSSKRG
jgi:hypothetical protein